MKHQLIDCFTNALLVLAGLSVGSVALAQPPTKLCTGPESETTFTISIAGDHLEDIKVVSLHFRGPDRPVADQSGFQTDFGSDKSRNLGPGKFEVSAVTQKYQADGSYVIDQVSINNGAITKTYLAAEFTAPPALVVCNPKHFGPYTIQKIEQNH